MYPATIINQKIYPEHLGLEFLDIYKKVFDLRLSAKKTGNKTVAAALKLSLNGGGFGKMGAKKSWMKDGLAMYRVTFCGQLSLLLLIEQYYLADIKVINANTDSITILFNKDKQDVIEKINKDWQEITSYQLEQTVYTKLIQRDINNYLAIKSDKSGSVKQKGCFITEPEVHQNHSQRIVAVALEKYFVNNIPIEDTIKECKDVYDFCCFFKKRGECRVEARGESIEKLGKTIRYYVSNSGVTLMKIMPPLPKKVKEGKLDEREINIQKGYLCTAFNKYNKKLIEEYDINYQFYISECMKIINNINKI